MLCYSNGTTKETVEHLMNTGINNAVTGALAATQQLYNCGTNHIQANSKA